MNGIDSSNYMSITNNNIDNKSLIVLPSNHENIKINLYSLSNEQIDSYYRETFNQLYIIYNPKRRA